MRRSPHPSRLCRMPYIPLSTVLLACLVASTSEAQVGSPGPRSIRPIIDSTVLMMTPAFDSSLTSDRPPAKSVFRGEPNRPNRALQGGDTFANATVIAALPYADNGSTAGYVDDYFESCIGGGGSPDVVYAYTPTSNVTVSIALCGSSYDTYLHVYANTYTPGSPLACNDDYCGLGSQIDGLPMAAGTTYYIVIDGYYGSYGSYQLQMSAQVPCGVTCPPGAIAEGETCVTGGPDNFNGGCNSYPPAFSPISCGDTICGTAYSSSSYGLRDTDWYLKTFAADTTVTWTVVADFPTRILLMNLSSGCYGVTYIRNVAAAACDTVSVTADLAAGTYVFFVAPLGWSDAYACENGPWNYTAWLTCQAPPPPPPNNSCADAIPIGEVTDLPFTTSGASHDGGYSCTGGPNVWYCYTATCTGTARIAACGNGYPTVVAAYNGCSCPTGALLDCRYNPCSPASRVSFPVIAGQTYLIEVATYSGVTGPGVLNVACVPAPPNNFCEDVTPVPLPATFTGDNTGAINQCPNLSGGHVWHAFTIDECMDVTLDHCGTSPAFGNGWLVLVRGCPCDTFIIADNYDFYTCSDGNVAMRWFSLPPGTYYYPVMVDPNYNAEGPYTIHVTGTPIACRYCRARGGCDEHIARVELGTINNYSGCSGYEDYTSLSTELWKKLSYTITVTNGNPYYGDRCGVWVDWNNDLDFFDSEETIFIGGSPGGSVFQGNIVPPDGPTTDTVTMRVRITWQDAVVPCGNTYYGEVEDYTLILKHFACGDWTGDGLVNQADITAIMDYYFNSGPCAVPCEASDATCDNTSNLADIMSLVRYVYGDGPPPCCGP